MEYKHRIADQMLAKKLASKGAVLIEGPKWCGKTTTAEQQARSILYMDNPASLETNLQMAKDLGYSTFFWSLAYVDWNVDAQPSHEEAFSKLTGRIHPGAVVLLHNTSKTNGEILDELLTKWEEMGYTFGKLEELVQ